MTPLAALPYKRSLFTFLCALLLLCVSAHPAIGQSTQTQANTPSQPKPVSLPHLYWHFLIHQNDLDNMAAKLQAKGRDGDALRSDLQIRLGFSNADYAPIRTSSQRLASELKPINDQLRSLAHTPANASQVRKLIAERDMYIENEASILSVELSPQNKAALEKFMAQFFAPKQLTFNIPASAGQTAGSGVSK